MAQPALKRYNSALLRIAKHNFLEHGDLPSAMKFVTEIAAEALQVERCSIWLYNQDKSAIVCQDLFETSGKRHTQGTTLHSKDFPNYFRYLREERTLPAHDAHRDPATQEFSQVYLKPLNIFSMLDAPIRIGGEVMGVVCNEQVGRKRTWELEEETFAGVIADFVGRIHESYEKEHTEQLLAQQRLQAMQAMKMAELGQMASGIAHEINGPLQIILSNAELMNEMLSGDDAPPETLKKCNQSIIQTANRIAKMVKGLKNFSYNGSYDSTTDVSLSQLVQETAALCQEKFRSGKIEFRIEHKHGEQWIHANSTAISQVILNLLNNAYDAISSKPDPWIQISTWLHDGFTCISVTDCGPGIPPAVRERLMQPFFTTKPAGVGTGLGLNLSKGIIESHGGTLTVDYDCPNTRFVIRLPKKAAAKKAA